MYLANVSFALHMARHVTTVGQPMALPQDVVPLPQVCQSHQESDQGEEVFQTSAPRAGVDDAQCVTLKLDSNVVPLNLYMKATKDNRLSQVKPVSQRITVYGGS